MREFARQSPARPMASRRTRPATWVCREERRPLPACDQTAGLGRPADGRAWPGLVGNVHIAADVAPRCSVPFFLARELGQRSRGWTVVRTLLWRPSLGRGPRRSVPARCSSSCGGWHCAAAPVPGDMSAGAVATSSRCSASADRYTSARCGLGHLLSAQCRTERSRSPGHPGSMNAPERVIAWRAAAAAAMMAARDPAVAALSACDIGSGNNPAGDQDGPGRYDHVRPASQRRVADAAVSAPMRYGATPIRRVTQPAAA